MIGASDSAVRSSPRAKPVNVGRIVPQQPQQTCCFHSQFRRTRACVDDLGSQAAQDLGYVGTSGNAPKNTPHLHFAVFRLTVAKHWWEGTPIDPYPILR